MKKLLVLSLALVMMVAVFAGCGSRNIDENLVGTWYAGPMALYTLNEDGTGTMMGIVPIEWWVSGNTFYTSIEGESVGVRYTYEDGVFTITEDGEEIVLTQESSGGFELPELPDGELIPEMPTVGD